MASDTAAVHLVDPTTRRTIMNCSELAVDNMKYVGNNEEYEFINVVQANSIYGKLAKAIKYDDMPSPEDLNHDAVAFVQHASSIASSLQNGKKAVVFCKNGRSRSPCVVAAFYIIFRGLSLLEIKTWFNEVYPRQRPITAAVSSAFPNIDKFENILNLLGRCLADPKKTTWGFNLADIVAKCSEAHGTPLHLAGSIDHVDYYSVPPSLRRVFAANLSYTKNNKNRRRSRKRTAAATTEPIETKKEKKNSTAGKKQSDKKSEKKNNDTKSTKKNKFLKYYENESVSDGSCFSGGGFGPFSPTMSEAEVDIGEKPVQKLLTYRAKQHISTLDTAEESVSSGDDCSATPSASNGTETESDDFESVDEIQVFAKNHLVWRGEKWLSTPSETMMSTPEKSSATIKRKQRNTSKKEPSPTKKSPTDYQLSSAKPVPKSRTPYKKAPSPANSKQSSTVSASGSKKNASEIDTKLAPNQFCERLCLVKSSSDTDFAFTPSRAGPDQTVSVHKLWPALKFSTFNDLMDQLNMNDADKKAVNRRKSRFTVETTKLLRKAGISRSDAGFAYLLGKGNQSSNFLTLLRKNGSGELIEDGVIFDFFDSKVEMDKSEGYCATSEFQHAFKIAMTRMEVEEKKEKKNSTSGKKQSNKKSKKEGNDRKGKKTKGKKTKGKKKTKILTHLHENESVSDGSCFSGGGFGPSSLTMGEAEVDIGVKTAQKRLTYWAKRPAKLACEESASDISSLV